jgi:uncharacterized membrane protein YccF (DUF307 family)
MSDNKELHYRRNAMSHLKSAIFWTLTIIGLPLATIYYMLFALDATLAIGHHAAGWVRLFRTSD